MECSFQGVWDSVGSSLLFAWINWFEKHLPTIWNMVQACLMCLVWQEHIIHTFEDNKKPIDLLKSLLFGSLF